MLETKNLENIPKYYVLTEIQPEQIIFRKETNEKVIKKEKIGNETDEPINELINEELLRKK